MILSRLALLGVAVAAPAAAEPIQFSGVLQGAIGYGTNPFTRAGVTEGSFVGSGSFAPKFLYQTARSTTTLQGRYSRDQYASHFGYRDSASVSLDRVDLITQQLTSTLSADFNTSNNATISDPTAISEPLDIGRRTYRESGQYQLQWQASAKDQLVYGAQIEHVSYGNSNKSGLPSLATSSYTQYSANVGYNRAVDARTTIGAQISVSAVRSQLYPDSRTIQPSLVAKRQLSAVWEVDGNIGIVLQHVYGPFASSTTSIGYGVNLCGTYPRTHICIGAQHQTAPSGYGALRTNTGVNARITHDLTEHSRVSLTANYYKTSADRGLIGPIGVTANARAVIVSGQYDRDLTQRVSAGFGGNYQWRKTEIFGSGHSVSGTVHVTAKLGRL